FMARVARYIANTKATIQVRMSMMFSMVEPGNALRRRHLIERRAPPTTDLILELERPGAARVNKLLLASPHPPE
ncbi:MAG: hypothetical protein WBZ25_10095, partial [Pseudolabrys sp.]